MAVVRSQNNLIAATLPSSTAIPGEAKTEKWRELPPTPPLPLHGRRRYAEINGTSIFFAQFGEGAPLVFLHGGLANSNYWGNQIEAFSSKYSVLVMDTRGHGRSPVTSSIFSYKVFATDVLALLDFLNIDRATIVGWSDGG
jgi:alpha-beta hydrolase superfamily lysophospholipase